MLRTRYKEWQEQGTPMVPLHFTGTRAGTTWVATWSQLNMLPAFAEGLEARTSLPALPLPAGSRTAATQHTKPLTGLSPSCCSSSLPRIMFILLQLYRKPSRLIQIFTLLIFSATSSELIQLESDLTSQECPNFPHCQSDFPLPTVVFG